MWDGQCISVHIRCMTMWGWHVTGSCRFHDDMWRSQAWPFLSEALTWPASVTYVTRLRTICWPLLSQQRWIPTLCHRTPRCSTIQQYTLYTIHYATIYSPIIYIAHTIFPVVALLADVTIWWHRFETKNSQLILSLHFFFTIIVINITIATIINGNNSWDTQARTEKCEEGELGELLSESCSCLPIICPVYSTHTIWETIDLRELLEQYREEETDAGCNLIASCRNFCQTAFQIKLTPILLLSVFCNVILLSVVPHTGYDN